MGASDKVDALKKYLALNQPCNCSVICTDRELNNYRIPEIAAMG